MERNTNISMYPICMRRAQVHVNSSLSYLHVLQVAVIKMSEETGFTCFNLLDIAVVHVVVACTA